MVDNLPANTGESRDVKFDSWVRRSWEVGNKETTPMVLPENPMDRKPWWATDHGSQRDRKELIQLSTKYTNTQNVNNSNSILFIPSLTVICCLCKIKI